MCLDWIKNFTLYFILKMTTTLDQDCKVIDLYKSLIYTKNRTNVTTEIPNMYSVLNSLTWGVIYTCDL